MADTNLMIVLLLLIRCRPFCKIQLLGILETVFETDGLEITLVDVGGAITLLISSPDSSYNLDVQVSEVSVESGCIASRTSPPLFILSTSANVPSHFSSALCWDASDCRGRSS